MLYEVIQGLKVGRTNTYENEPQANILVLFEIMFCLLYCLSLSLDA